MSGTAGESKSVDVRLAEIQGALETMSAGITERLNHLSDKMGSGAADLHTHVHHANPHTEQEDWIRRLIDSRYENLTRLLDLHVQEADREVLVIREQQRAVQTRTDQQDGALRLLKGLVAVLSTGVVGAIATIIAQWSHHN